MTTTFTFDFDGNVTIEKDGDTITLTPDEVHELCKDAHMVAQYPTPCAKNIIPVYTTNTYPTYIEVRNDKS